MDPKPDEKDLGPNPFVFTSETGLFLALIVVISTFSIFALSGLLAMTVMNLMVAFIYNRLIFLVVIALFLATLILTYLLVPFIFLVKPLYQIRSEKLVPMGRVRPDIEADILATARRVGLKGRVKILYNYTDAIESYSIGNWFTGYIVLSRGFLGQMADKPDLFKAIISHEIAHLYNRDVVRAELSISMLRVVSLLLVSNIVAFLIYLSGPLTWWTSTPVAAARTFSFTYLSIACFSLSLFLILAIFLRYLVISVLRSRELYADVRAVQFTGDKKALLKALIMSEAIAYRSDRKNCLRIDARQNFTCPVSSYYRCQKILP